MIMGFVKIDRKIFANPVWSIKPFSKGQAWIDLVLMANYATKKTHFKGEQVTIKRGQLYCSCDYLGQRWGWSRYKATRFLDYLAQQKMITVKRIKGKYTIIHITNYSLYQDKVNQNSEDKYNIDWDKIPD